ncbi:SDR family NAD(P)-dependent oxidoreductase [Bifidobacterium aquikefiricola]|uniref:SDR family oxidoreductase n=1 Tax=Bifidobacterium aquikefiricola TaxID=3059038 RepID=A0AB39U8J2_9BIFI
MHDAAADSPDHYEHNVRPVVIITGGGSGIGQECARHLAAHQWEVVIAGRRAQALEHVSNEIGATAVTCDIESPQQCEELINTVAARFGRLDGLVLSASASFAGPFNSLSHERWSTTVQTNIVGNADLCRQALPLLAKSQGSIVAVSSLAALRASSYMSAYAASKAGLSMLIQSLAVEFGSKGVRANAVCPCWVRTDMADRSMELLMQRHGIDLDEAYRIACAYVPLQRPARADEISPLVSFLLSSQASFINGAIIPVDGGASAVDVGALGFRS